MAFGGGGSPPIWGESVRRGLAGEADDAAAHREATASRAQLDADEASELAIQEAARLVEKPAMPAPAQPHRGLLDRLFRRSG
jgi:hypothetical protein